MNNVVSIELSHKAKAALDYAELGWHVFPVWWIGEDGQCACGHDACRNPGKHPVGHLVARGQLDASNDPAKIRRWWTQCPHANIGVNLKASGLAVVDVDPRNGGNETLDQIVDARGPFSTDVHQFSGGGGQHFFFLRPDEITGIPGTLGAGIDMLLNKYVLLEPSNHHSGGTYEWEGSSSPLEGNVPGPLPDWIRDLAMPRAQAAETQSIETGVRYADDEQLADLWDALQSIDSDDRNTWVMVGMALRELGEPGFVMWDRWSQRSHKYRPGECAKKWRTDIKPGTGYHFETVFGVAKEAGWVNNSSKRKKAKPDDDYDFDVDLSDIEGDRAVAGAEGDIERHGNLALIFADRIEPQHVQWVWPGYIARGKLNVMAGDPGCGKTMIACSIIASATAQIAFGDGFVVDEPMGVRMFTSEDDLGDTLIPRLHAAGADLSRVAFIEGGYDKDGKRKPFDPRSDLAEIARAFKERPFDLLILDSLADCVKGDSNKNEDVRLALEALRKMAEHCGFGVLGIMHQTKGSAGQKAQNRVLGSVAFVGKARLVMNACKGQDGEDSILVVSKANNTSTDKGFSYRMEPVQFTYKGSVFEEMRIKWTGEIKEGATAAMNRLEGVVQEKTVREKAKDAQAWILEYLSGGPKLSTDMQDDAAVNGYSYDTLRNARDKLRSAGAIESSRRMDSKVQWSLVQ